MNLTDTINKLKKRGYIILEATKEELENWTNSGQSNLIKQISNPLLLEALVKSNQIFKVKDNYLRNQPAFVTADQIFKMAKQPRRKSKYWIKEYKRSRKHLKELEAKHECQRSHQDS